MLQLRTLVIVSILLCPGSALALVNINTATLAELDSLPGVGPATAEKIIAARPFSATSDIQMVSGIGGPGDPSYEKIIGLITVSGASAVTIEAADDEEETSPDHTSETEREKKVYSPVEELVLSAPDVAYVNQPVNFSVAPSDGRKNRLVRYHWNFGDGQTGDSASEVHGYKYPGTYVVIVESSYLKEQKVARHEIEVLPAEITLRSNPDGTVTLRNDGHEEIDLSGMTVQGSAAVIFPKHSILMPGKSMTISVPGHVPGHIASLMDQAGEVVAMSKGPTQTARPVAAAKQTRSANQPPTVQAANPVPLFGPVAAAAAPADLEDAATSPERWPYVGLLFLILIGLFATLGGQGKFGG